MCARPHQRTAPLLYVIDATSPRSLPKLCESMQLAAPSCIAPVNSRPKPWRRSVADVSTQLPMSEKASVSLGLISLAKIHLNFRLTYLKDVVMARYTRIFFSDVF